MEETTKATNIVTDTVRVLPKTNETVTQGLPNIVLNMANMADEIPKWGMDVHARDEALETFWQSEDYIASVIHALAMTRSALPWQLTGPPKSVDRVQKMLKRSHFNRGWQYLMGLVVVDLLTRDNGSYIEVVRGKPQKGRKPESAPVIALNHLPSSQCHQTGNPTVPVIFRDNDGKLHRLKWYQVIHLVEVPIPREDNKSIQFCFVSRVLNFAKTVKSISTYNREKIEGRFTKSVSVISGISQIDLDNIQEKAQIDANNQGLLRYSNPIILSTLDPSATVSSATLDLAGLPDGFDFSETIKLYITLLSLASGTSQIDLGIAIFGGGLGSSSQSGNLIEKSRVKSLLLFMKSIETALVNAMAIPPNVKFSFVNSDGDVEERDAEIKYRRAQTRSVMISDGTISPAIARQIATDQGDLNAVYLAMMGEGDEETITIEDNERVSESDTTGINAIPNNEEEVPIDVADAAAKWMTKVITNNQLNAILPIPVTQMGTFKTALRTHLTHETLLGTDDVWMDDVLLTCVNEAGINPMMLRSRMYDNYKLLVTKDYVKDNRGSTIYIKEHKKDTTKTIYMILEDLTLDNYEEKLNEILELTNATETKKYVTELHKLKYFGNVELLRLKLTATYYEKLAK